MNAYYGTEAWLLASREWGEADRLLTLFTKDLGRIDAIAKGVRLAKSKLRGHLTLFAKLRVMITPGKEFWRLLDAQIESPADEYATCAYRQEFSHFLLRLVTERELDHRLWVNLEMFPRISTRGELLRLEIIVLSDLGFLPDNSELGTFFSPPAVKFIRGDGDSTFLVDSGEADAFERGIAKILAAAHML